MFTVKISICIPTYNRPELLKQAIYSSVNQSFTPIEILIGDDSLNDESKNLVERIKSKAGINIWYFKNSPPLGQADNVNSLLNKVTGNFLLLLHDDDLLLNDALQNMKYCFELDPQIDAVYGKQYIIIEEGNIDQQQTEKLNRYYFRTHFYQETRLSSLEAGAVQQFPNDCYLIRTEVAQKVGYRGKEEVGDACDFDFGFRLGLNGNKLFFLNKFTAKYRLTKSSVARNGSDAGYQSFKIISESFLNDHRFKNKTIKDILKRIAPIAIMHAIETKRKKEALKIYFGIHHRNKIFSLGGVRRFLYLIK